MTVQVRLCSPLDTDCGSADATLLNSCYLTHGVDSTGAAH